MNKFTFILLSCLSVFLAWGMHFELYTPQIHMSDGAFHLSVLNALDQAFQNGRNPLDFWFVGTPFGFALFRAYQAVPYVVIYIVYLLLFKTVSLAILLSFFNLLLVSVLPWSIFISMRVFGLGLFEAVCGAVASALISDGGEFGFGLQLYTFGNNGLFTQIWALVFLPLALSFSYRSVTDGVYFRSALLFSFLTFGCHIMCAFILLFSLGVLFLFSVLKRDLIQIRRGVLFVFSLFFITSYQWIFTFLDSPYINQSLLEPAWKYEGRGFAYVFDRIISGSALDEGRFPSLTILFCIGCMGIIWGIGRIGSKQKYFGIYSFVCMLLFFTLYSGRDIWGWLFTDTPGLKSLHIHRFVIGFHLFAVYLIGIGCGVVFRESALKFRIIAVSSLFILSVPPLYERYLMYDHAGKIRLSVHDFLKTNRTGLDLVSSLSPGIVYTGATHNWQRETAQFGIPLHYFTTSAGIPTVGGALYHAFALSGETLFQFNVERKAHYNLYGISEVLAPQGWKGLPGFVREKTISNISIWKADAKVLSVGKLAFTLCGPKQLASNFLRRWVDSPLVERGHYGLITSDSCNSAHGKSLVSYSSEVPLSLDDKNEQKGEVVSVSQYLPWKIEGKVLAKAGDMVVLATSFHPQWKAFVDEKEVPTLWVTPGFVAMMVPEGEHSVRFEYFGSRAKFFILFFSILLTPLWYRVALSKEFRFTK